MFSENFIKKMVILARLIAITQLALIVCLCFYGLLQYECKPIYKSLAMLFVLHFFVFRMKSLTKKPDAEMVKNISDKV